MKIAIYLKIASKKSLSLFFLAEREGFEPSRAVTPYPLSRRAH